MVKIPLSDQIAEAELHRDALQKAVADKPHLLPRLDRAEAIVITLAAYEAFATTQRVNTNKEKQG